MRSRALLALALAAALAAPALADAKRPRVDDRVWSPNITPSRGRSIRYVVIHTMQGSYQGALSWFRNPASRVSAHYSVSRSGRLGQSVREPNVAWHAGNFTYNLHSIGIEHEGFISRRDNYTTRMLRKSAALTRYLCDRYRIRIDRKHIIAHKQVPGSTHTDPGPHFPWRRYLRMVRQAGGPNTVRTTARAVELTGAAVLRKSAGTRSARVGEAPRGQRFVRTHRQGKWYRVWFDGRAGWIPMSRVRVLAHATLAVVRARTQPRTAPRADAAKRRRVLEKGQSYVWGQRQDGWHQVWLGRSTSWLVATKVRLARH